MLPDRQKPLVYQASFYPLEGFIRFARQLITKIAKSTTSYKLWGEISVQVFSELIFCRSWELSRQAADAQSCKV